MYGCFAVKYVCVAQVHLILPSPPSLDLLSMIQRLSNDELADQRISPSPITPEPTGSDQRSSSDDLKNLSPGEMRKRTQSQGKRRSPNTHHQHHRPLAASKSIDSIDTSPPSSSHHHQGGSSSRGKDRHYREKRPSSRENMLRPPGVTQQQQKSMQITRTQSGGSMLSNGSSSSSASASASASNHRHHHHHHHPRSLSPPANVGSSSASSTRGPSAQALRSQTISPPPPTSKPPPLPSHAKRPGVSSRVAQPPPSARWSGVSFKSTDSASSEDSLTADLPRHPRQHGGSLEGGLEMRPAPAAPGGVQYFPRAHPPNQQNPQFGMAARAGGNGNQGDPPTDYPDGGMKNAYNAGMATSTSSSAGNLAVSSSQHLRKTSWQGTKPMDYSNASHPLQMSVSRGHSQSIGSTLSSYPWHNAHSLPHQQNKYPQQQQKR